jgi:hypothetical protein
MIGEQFLNGDADRRATAPDADKVRRRKAAIEHLPAEAKGIGKQIIGRNIALWVCHLACLPPFPNTRSRRMAGHMRQSQRNPL